MMKSSEGAVEGIRREVSDRPAISLCADGAIRPRNSDGGQENLLEQLQPGGASQALWPMPRKMSVKTSEDERNHWRKVLVRLVAWDTGGATRRRQSLKNLRSKTRLRENRRLSAGGCRWRSIEICHEQLITQWPWWQNCTRGTDNAPLAG
jgi:hypothetical protein